MSRILEICAASLASARAAQAGGAHRIELCQNLEQGGITPSYGLIRAVREQLSIPVFVLIRPRPGGFVYDADELATMRADIEVCRQLGCAGVVLGMLDATGRVDMAACQHLIEAANGLQVTFHRAIDACPDQGQALEEIIRLGCQRVLTSGGQATALEGQNQLAALITQAAGRISIMPGAGINGDNIQALANSTVAQEFHASAKRRVPADPAAGLFRAERFETDAVLVAELVAKL
ncbi:copper homeostasis protein CutC [Microvirga sp. STS02]|uniref:copper homeostasis protein CutC n=1 Tax=Hymenobacter negativus TaxID=2795026 RepID=UPI0018DC91F2|nr:MULTISPECIES: copper homeostasis protein CutC [Bacteria]MBH8567419.1 copper homeostasis protein CutC [Hymenobacter negativus]MBR7207151.1 copper homeostasis protein CutC [Microvirga sp. STS02]